jgi:hypothetical protein
MINTAAERKCLVLNIGFSSFRLAAGMVDKPTHIVVEKHEDSDVRRLGIAPISFRYIPYSGDAGNGVGLGWGASVDAAA